MSPEKYPQQFPDFQNLTRMLNEKCIFCRIIEGKAAAQILYKDDRVTAFLDTHPIAPVHILVVPNMHIESANEVEAEHEALLGHMVTVAAKLANTYAVQESGYRLVINTGPNTGQSIFHLHLHLIGGRHLPFHFR
jgi:histidine triad (HIT) family protein